MYDRSTPSISRCRLMYKFYFILIALLQSFYSIKALNLHYQWSWCSHLLNMWIRYKYFGRPNSSLELAIRRQLLIGLSLHVVSAWCDIRKRMINLPLQMQSIQSRFWSCLQEIGYFNLPRAYEHIAYRFCFLLVLNTINSCTSRLENDKINLFLLPLLKIISSASISMIKSWKLGDDSIDEIYIIFENNGSMTFPILTYVPISFRHFVFISINHG